MGTGSFRGVKRPGGGGANKPLPSNAEVANGLELHSRLLAVYTLDSQSKGPRWGVKQCQ